jgi:hypothetical protein
MSACNDNGTATTADDRFTADITVTFQYPPSSGTLNLSGDGSGSVSVSGFPALGGSHVFTGVSMLADSTDITLMAAFSASPLCALTVDSVDTSPAHCSDSMLVNLVINELDYDMPGSVDSAEFVELYNPGTLPVNLGYYQLVLVDGTGGIYKTYSLPNVMLAANDYFVVCADGSKTPNCDLDVTPNKNAIQNGPSDAVGLVVNSAVIDAVSYEGIVAGYNEGAPAPTDNGSAAYLGLSRLPDGTDTDDNSLDFSLRCISPGDPNLPATSSCSPPSKPAKSLVPPGRQSGGQSVTVFPNPASAEVSVQIEQEFDSGAMKVYDLQGRLMLAVTLEQDRRTVAFKTADWRRGAYFVQVQLDGGNFVILLTLE